MPCDKNVVAPARCQVARDRGFHIEFWAWLGVVRSTLSDSVLSNGAEEIRALPYNHHFRRSPVAANRKGSGVALELHMGKILEVKSQPEPGESDVLVQI